MQTAKDKLEFLGVILRYLTPMILMLAAYYLNSINHTLERMADHMDDLDRRVIVLETLEAYREAHPNHQVRPP